MICAASQCICHDATSQCAGYVVEYLHGLTTNDNNNNGNGDDDYNNNCTKYDDMILTTTTTTTTITKTYVRQCVS